MSSPILTDKDLHFSNRINSSFTFAKDFGVSFLLLFLINLTMCNKITEKANLNRKVFSIMCLFVVPLKREEKKHPHKPMYALLYSG